MSDKRETNAKVIVDMRMGDIDLKKIQILLSEIFY